MAVSKVPGNSVLRLELRVGVGEGDNPVYRNKSLGNIKSAASDQDMFDVANALADLQEYPLEGISRTDNAQLVEV